MIESKKRGRPLTLGELDSDVQTYIRGLRKAGTPVNLPVIVAGATGIVTAKDRSLLAENGGHISHPCLGKIVAGKDGNGEKKSFHKQVSQNPA